MGNEVFGVEVASLFQGECVCLPCLWFLCPGFFSGGVGKFLIDLWFVVGTQLVVG